MIGIEFTRFDQNAILLSLFCCLSLFRERRPLPFVLVILGALLQGALISCLLASLIVLHRMERGSGKWIQIKDAVGMFFILAGTISPELGRAFFSLIGVTLLSVNFGGGMLGTLPALLFLRQYHPNPEFLEIALVGHSIYWILREVSRWTEIPGEHQVLSWSEVVGSILILSNFKGEAEATVMVPELSIIAGIFLVILISGAIWSQVRADGFRSFFLNVRANLEKAVFSGSRFVSDREPWSAGSRSFSEPQILLGIQGVFWWIIGVFIISVLTGFFLHGGDF